MTNEKLTRTSIIKDLELIYKMAIASESFAVALKAKELLGREFGLFAPKKKPKISLANLSEEDLQRLIMEIEKELVLDHHQGRE